MKILVLLILSIVLFSCEQEERIFTEVITFKPTKEFLKMETAKDTLYFYGGFLITKENFCKNVSNNNYRTFLIK